MREKLIELIKARIENKTWCVSELADYLLANGVVVMPCKVGDVIYDIHDGKVFCGKIAIIIVFDDCFKFTATGGRYYAIDDIGKTVFLNREDAERALKGDKE